MRLDESHLKVQVVRAKRVDEQRKCPRAGDGVQELQAVARFAGEVDDYALQRYLFAMLTLK